MARKRKEAVTVSFHHMRRMRRDADGEYRLVRFNSDQFQSIVTTANNLPKVDFKDEKLLNKLRFTNTVIFDKDLILHNEKTIVGTYRNAYSGHAFDNTEKGLIAADSINLRPFHFVLYHSDDGKIYIGTQYIGLYGGYTGLEAKIRSLLPDAYEIQSASFRLGGSSYQNAIPKEVRVTFHNQSHSISAPSHFTKRGIITFKKTRDDDGFIEEVRRDIMPLVGQPSAAVKKALGSVLRQGDLMSVDDEDIQDCTVLADVNGKTAVINMIDAGSFATRFPLNVGIDEHGHPLFEPTRDAMIKVLTDEIISKHV